MDRYIIGILIACIILGVYFVFTIKKDNKKAAAKDTAIKEKENTLSLPEENKSQEKKIDENAAFFDIIDIDSIEEDIPAESLPAESNNNADLFNLFSDNIKQPEVKPIEPKIEEKVVDNSDPYGTPKQEILNTKEIPNSQKEVTPSLLNNSDEQTMDERIAKILNELQNMYSEAQLEEITKLLVRRADLNAKTIRRIIDKNADPDKIRKYAQRYN